MKEGIKFMKNHIKLFPNNLEFYKYMCHLCKRQRDFDSLSVVLHAIPLKLKQDVDILRYYGRLAMRSKMFHEAVDIFKK
jgi:CRISPR/Cas system Type II protein with McrA/HNH and RuvC-like nuclease domain